jgi:hypothetical protein
VRSPAAAHSSTASRPPPRSRSVRVSLSPVGVPRARYSTGVRSLVAFGALDAPDIRPAEQAQASHGRRQLLPSRGQLLGRRSWVHRTVAVLPPPGHPAVQQASHPPAYTRYLAAGSVVGFRSTLGRKIWSCILEAAAIAVVALAGVEPAAISPRSMANTGASPFVTFARTSRGFLSWCSPARAAHGVSFALTSN